GGHIAPTARANSRPYAHQSPPRSCQHYQPWSLACTTKHQVRGYLGVFGRLSGSGRPDRGMPGLAAGYEELVGSSPRLSDSQIAALSGRRRGRSPTAAGPGHGAGGDPDAGAGASYRLDMTGSSSARQVTSTPAAMIASAPTKATPRQGKAANTTWDGKPETPVPAAWPAPPPVVLPMSDPVTPEPAGAPVPAAAAARTAAAEIPELTATAMPTPNPASSTPATRRRVRRVARTAARPARAASASAPATGTSVWPVTAVTL